MTAIERKRARRDEMERLLRRLADTFEGYEAEYAKGYALPDAGKGLQRMQVVCAEAFGSFRALARDAQEMLSRESGDSVSAVGLGREPVSAGASYVNRPDPPVLNKTGGSRMNRCAACGYGADEFEGAAWEGPCPRCGAPAVNKSGGSDVDCRAVFRVGGGGPVYTCNLPRGHEGRHIQR